tara:strand:- start:184 stop:1620 length:1437 start_codon:yes stop_codon:yes gene_type:complete
VKNKFNKIDSKEWLPFQKSFYRIVSDEELYRNTIRFFCDPTKNATVEYYGCKGDILQNICVNEGLKSSNVENHETNDIQFLIFDLRDEINEIKNLKEYEKLKKKIESIICLKKDNLIERRFVCVLANNIYTRGIYRPFAWEIAKSLGKTLSLKDEKIICYDEGQFEILNSKNVFSPSKETAYQLFFRKDDDNEFNKNTFKVKNSFLSNTKEKKSVYSDRNRIDSWFILKPPRRNKLEILHPAKYPESLVESFVENFTDEDDFIFDPMSGSGSTQIGSLKSNRNALGTELSTFFCNIANERCDELINPKQTTLFESEEIKNTYRILNIDARKVTKKLFPKIDYMITSPPYWDMLNMQGAENQAKRIEKGLMTNYSDEENDLGNIDDYEKFIDELVGLYIKISDLMEPGSYITIVVKNIKKKGRNYPFAWDLANKLIPHMTLIKETFWCQDDISIAPFGYGNTWVSNTFHQYCLTFQIKI